MDDAANFERDISDYCDRAGEQAKLFVTALVLNLQSRIQDRMPVLTGRLRASVQPAQPLSAWEPGQTITLASGLEYSARIEFGFVGQDALGRHYNQRGVGAFTQAFNEFDDIAEETWRQVFGDDRGGGSSPSGLSGGGSGGAELSGVLDVAEELADAALGYPYEAAFRSMGTWMSGVEAFTESMASIAEAAAEFGVIL